MSTITISVKHDKTTHEVNVDKSKPFSEFQKSLFTLTNVPPERQKLIAKGKQLKVDADIQALTKGAKVMMTGSADALVDAPSKPITFVEDLPASQQNQLQAMSSAGLVNLGNTCYMNSTIQNLRFIPELRSALDQYESQRRMAGEGDNLTSFMGRLFNSMDKSVEPVTPAAFTQTLRTLYPQFAQTDEKGRYRQQDADECLSQILYSLTFSLTNIPKAKAPVVDGGKHLVDYLFTGEVKSEMTCVEEATEPKRVGTENFTKLRCFIDIDTNYLYQGLQKGMEEDLELRSSVLGRTAIFKKTAVITRLPRLLNIQYVRFFWKKDTNKKSKIVRKVQFPEKLDLMEFCDVDLKASFSFARTKVKEEEDLKAGISAKDLKQNQKEKNDAAARAAGAIDEDLEREKAKNARRAAKRQREEEGLTVAEKALGLTLADKEKITKEQEEKEKNKKATIADGKISPQSGSGFYELHGVVTHKGRDADSGHYIGWVRNKGDEWWKFDDEEVSSVDTQAILALAGGGDWHTCYMLFYRRMDDLVERPASWWVKSAEADKPDQTPK